MVRRRQALAPLLAALAALVATTACGTDATGTAAAPSLDVAALIGQTRLPTLPRLGIGADLVPLAPFTVTAACVYAAAAARFECPATTSSGLTVTMSYALADAAGRPLATADSATTASVRTITAVTGTLAVPGGAGSAAGAGGSLTVVQRQDLTLSGVLGATRTLDGTATSKIDGTITAGSLSQPISTSVSETVTRVVLPTGAGGPSSWPISGTIVDDITTGVTGAGSPLVIREEITFNGTSRVPVTITAGGQTQRCTLDLARPATLPTCS